MQIKNIPFNLFVIPLLAVILTGYGDNSASTSAPPVATVDPNLLQKSKYAPSIAIYGFGDSSFVSTTDTVKIAGASNSSSGKAITLTPNLNSKDLSAIALDANGFYSITTKLVPGDNTLILTAKEKDGLTKTKKVVLLFVENSTISTDFSLDVDSVAESHTKTLTASISFNGRQVQTVDVISYPAGVVVASMKDDGTLPDRMKADNVYTSNFSFTASVTGNKCFRAKVTLLNNETHQTGIDCLSIFKLQTNETVNISNAIGKSIVSLISKESPNITQVEKSKNVINTIKKNKKYNDTFETLEYDEIGNIYWITKDGVSGAHLVVTKGTRGL